MKELNNESGLYYYGARYYASWLGRWISVDPMLHKNNFEAPYVYVNNRPIVMNDPDGEDGKVFGGIRSWFRATFWGRDRKINKYGDWVVKNDTGKTRNYGGSWFRKRRTPDYEIGVGAITFGWLNDGTEYQTSVLADKFSVNNIILPYYPDGRIEEQPAFFFDLFTLGIGFEKSITKNVYPKYVWRGDSRSYSQIFKSGGFIPRGEYDDIIVNTIKANPNSAFVCTSQKKKVAKLFAQFDSDVGYIYKIKNPGNGVNVNKFFRANGLKNPYSWQKEISFKGSIKIKYIKKVQMIKNGKIIK